MKCPVCTSVNLVMSERQGIEIDYCPECRGVWLDRGELDKIIERTNVQPVEQPVGGNDRNYRPPEQPAYQVNQGQPHHHEQRGHGYVQGQPYKKKKSLLAEIFDFD